MKKFDVIIIGLGPAGAAAAIYSARAGLSSVVFEGNAPGGQVSSTDLIENYPGIASIEGWKLATEMEKQSANCGTSIIYESVASVDLYNKTIKTVSETYASDAIIICGGAKRRELGLDGEKKLIGKGISYCAVCDGGFYKGKTVAVVGGGETAVGDAIYLARLCKKVYLIHRRDSLRASKSKQKILNELENVEIVYNSAIEKLIYNKRIGKILLNSGREIVLDGLFVAIGSQPDSELYHELELDDGYIVTDESMATSIPGVYAAGDIRKKAVRQIVTAASDGAIAAISAAEYLEDNKINDAN